MNNVKTMVLMAGLMGLFLLAGQLLGGSQGLVLALVLGGAFNFIMYFFSDRMVLRMYGAHVVTEAEAPELYRMVDRLRQRAGLPMPTVAVAPHEQPNAFATGRNPEHAGHILDRCAGLHRAEGDDLAHAGPAVALADVLDHLAPALEAEVDVDVGHRHALGIEEPLEQQVELERADVGDAERVRHDRAGRRAAAGAHRDPAVARRLDEVVHDQEIPGAAAFFSASDMRMSRFSCDITRNVWASGVP